MLCQQDQPAPARSSKQSHTVTHLEQLQIQLHLTKVWAGEQRLKEDWTRVADAAGGKQRQHFWLRSKAISPVGAWGAVACKQQNHIKQVAPFHAFCTLLMQACMSGYHSGCIATFNLVKRKLHQQNRGQQSSPGRSVSVD